MELPAILAFSPGPQPVAGGRAPTPSQAVPRETALREATSKPSNQKTATERSSGAEAARRGGRRPEEDVRHPETAAAPGPATTVGRVRFELEEGTRVAKFFDTKDVLIYQVPPEGRIYLVKARETSAKDQVETSA